jgi:hypothetical protein
LTVIVVRRDGKFRRTNGDLPMSICQLCSFQGPGRAQPEALSGWSLKTQQYGALPGDTLCATRVTSSDSVDIPGTSASLSPAGDRERSAALGQSDRRTSVVAEAP